MHAASSNVVAQHVDGNDCTRARQLGRTTCLNTETNPPSQRSRRSTNQTAEEETHLHVVTQLNQHKPMCSRRTAPNSFMNLGDNCHANTCAGCVCVQRCNILQLRQPLVPFGVPTTSCRLTHVCVLSAATFWPRRNRRRHVHLAHVTACSKISCVSQFD